MNYQTYVEDFFSYMYNNFSGLDSIIEIEKRYKELLKIYPNFYTICDNNLNFLFIEDFRYTPQLLTFLSDKIDLNFIGGVNMHSPLTYHFCRANNDTQVLNLTKNIETQNFLEKFQNKFYNYLSFREFDLEMTYVTDDYNNRSSINAELLKTFRRKDYKNADWRRIVDFIFKDIFKLHVHPELFYLNDPVSLSSQFLALINSLPNKQIEEKTLLFNYLDLCLGNKIDWQYKNSQAIPFAYEFIDALIKNIPNHEEHSTYEYNNWKAFADFVVYDKILPSGFSFHNKYRKSESLYYYIENFWLKPNQFEEKNNYATNFFEDLFKKSLVTEERLKISSQVTHGETIKTIRKI